MNIDDKENLKLRILSAVVLMPLAVGAIYMGGWFFLVFLVTLYLVCMFEWIRMARLTRRAFLWIGVGFVYLTIGFLVFYALQYQQDVALGFVAAVWMSDIMAYVFGKLIGGIKLIPKVSPKKTWAGLLGAILGSVCITYFWSVSFMKSSHLDVPFELPDILFLGVLMGLSCQAGDLFISVFKRQANVKDTGNIIPGHGGALDRLDSLLMAAISVCMYFLFAGGLI